MKRKISALLGSLCLVALAACGGSDAATDQASTETMAPTETTAAAAGVSLAGVCP
ncbi:MAG: hypothetical protein NT119_00040 [Actinobacteria bacterium]|nr:hypothetical protein [Actinomycetota bacterium]